MYDFYTVRIQFKEFTRMHVTREWAQNERQAVELALESWGEYYTALELSVVKTVATIVEG